MKKPLNGERPFNQGFYGPNLGYVIELYENYLQDPNSIDPEMRAYFDETGSPVTEIKDFPKSEANVTFTNSNVLEKTLAAIRLADNIRFYGHRAADIYPLKNHEPERKLFELSRYGLTEEDLKAIPANLICTEAKVPLRNGHDAIEYLKSVYMGTIAFEFHHVDDENEKEWLRKKVESNELNLNLKAEEKTKILRRLTEVEEFEKYLHRTFVGQKRFSIEGLDSMVPLLDEIVSESVSNGTKTINIGMAHRGRLNVLAHVLGKPYEMIFAEFQHAPNKELVPSEGSIGISYGWTGDVKYHLGLDKQIKDENTTIARLTLANNPSHLEFVGAVVEGYTRAAQDDRTSKGYPEVDFRSALSIIIHGDAAFPGQGVVAETLNLGQLKGYDTGGSIHIIANNTIGFTTESYDSRSTRYSSDLAKGYEIPILHVNANDPEACVAAARLACEYREKFQKDFLIDLIGYRRFGHNEMDEPMTTNPLMYKIIHQEVTVKNLYADKLISQAAITKDEASKMEEAIIDKLKSAYEKVPNKKIDIVDMDPPETVEKGLPNVNTAVPIETLKQMNQELLGFPENFFVFNKLDKILKRRLDALEGEAKIDWGHAETLAFASIVNDGTPIRLTGQDSERGTFAHRNIVLHDNETGKSYSPLHLMSTAKASFAVHNSPLSEMAVLGFEYGYNVFAPETLVLWEAQFGDFANSAQVMFDQFIAAGRAKWGQKSGLVMLLPHGYEGQGPEHSSARLERFLTLAAENNWTVANLSSSAQYFHILRRQAAILNREEVRPLVIMSPKSLLRHQLVASSAKDLSEGEFRPVLEQPGLGKETESVTRLVLASGKMAIDLAENLKRIEDQDWFHIVRVEEIYPFPMDAIKKIMNRYPNLKEILWVQEEPKNMGAWTFVEPRLKKLADQGEDVSYVGRRRRSSPSEGDPIIHKHEQARIIEEALTQKQEGGN
ncbi:2-oxoglutarate dehydrogenase E1 component [Bacillus sp. DTU_2020_1000418_1_SI_GHA_SEK_038]|uniref:2-oxoglutarate dehydrogenase E1 component n=1 Tax=Bacillus sp. DTU_2020_1000418_1_SI_GHA_SEK_038 TaxID=3077585 RepID=UPI0028E95B23|nr:2-oxoglutarate dehydrogenase E1 component [Bacillus sp. DTU_2020_1000418_1_SI_GHA_SEK_038]WNS73524.1 2-oxoglutarate dehydrogenase E1 component [Bacillus sp. DTU_2020_1000418_1_SI_GHA_SEK_038]